MSKNQKKIRVALLVDSLQVPAWAYRMLSLLQQSQKAEIVLILKNQSAATVESGLFSRLKKIVGRRYLAYLLHRKVDRRLGSTGKDPFLPASLEALMPDAKVVSVVPLATEYSDRLPESVCEQIVEAEVDLGIRLGFRILRGPVLSAPKYGVWSYHHGDAKTNRGGPPCFWEVMEGWPVTGATLQILSEDLDAGLVLSRTFSTTDPSLVERNKRRVYWNSAPLLPRAVERLYDLGGEKFFEELETQNRELSFYSGRLYRTPTNAEMMAASARYLARIFGQKILAQLRAQRWMLFFRFQDTSGPATSLRKFKILVPPCGHQWADPFSVCDSGTYHLFFEDLRTATGKAGISCMTYDEETGWSHPFEVLRRDYHLSYPFVFGHEGSYYMIPETAENRTIELYKSSSFPAEWEMVEVLMTDISARDTTLVYRDGLWWMFTCTQEYSEMSTWQELSLFYSENLLGGEWKAHPRNPIVSDARFARPAGRLFEKNGHLYRPSQNCGGCYGSSISLNRVKRLTRTHYEEQRVGGIEPSWSASVERVHTLNHCKKLTVVDGLVSEFRFQRAFFGAYRAVGSRV